MYSVIASSRARRQARPAPFSLLHTLFGLAGVRRSRARLASLDERMLRDIGVSRAEALRESRRPTWDVPRGWRI